MIEFMRLCVLAVWLCFDGSFEDLMIVIDQVVSNDLKSPSGKESS